MGIVGRNPRVFQNQGFSVCGKFLGIIGRDHSVSISNQLHVVTFQVFFIDMWYIL